MGISPALLQLARHPRSRILVITPAGLVTSVWKRECEKFIQNLKRGYRSLVSVLSGAAKTKFTGRGEDQERVRARTPFSVRRRSSSPR